MTGESALTDRTRPRVSVVVPAHNEERTLGRTLRALAQQAYPDLQVIVVDDGSTDGTGDVARGFPDVTLIRHETGRGLALSYNSGIAAADGDIIATLHADCVPTSPEWVSRCVGHFATPDVGIVTTPFVSPGREELGWIEFVFMYALRGDRDASAFRGDVPFDVRFISGKCDFYRGSLLRDLGGFRPITPVAGEDKDLSFRVRQRGFRILMEPGAPVAHLYGSHQQGLVANWSKAFQYGEAARGVYRAQGRFHSREIAANTVLLVLLVGGSLASVALRSWLPALAGVGLLFAKNVCKALPVLGKTRSPLLYLASIPIGMVDNILMGLGVLKGPGSRHATDSAP
jgi:GT2 family glycosyltransferase